MPKYYVMLTDECGEDFGVTIDAPNEEDAWETARMDYPESDVLTVSVGMSRAQRYADRYSDHDYDDDDDGLSSRQKEMNDRLDMGRNEAGEWVGFM